MNKTYLSPEEMKSIFEKQQLYAQKVRQTSAKERKQKLQLILDYLLDKENQSEIIQAIHKDMKRPEAEAFGAEVVALIGVIKNLKRNLNRWLKPKRKSTPLTLFGATSYIWYEPKGTCLIISPWNYPIQLAIKPLLFAIAAGNTAIIKPSEYAPASSKILKKMIHFLFNEEEVAVIEGEVKETTVLMSFPFNHIYFTGSPSVGKIVMEAASKNLSSVTLELGGKSPCIVDETVNVTKMAPRIVWGKLYNAGQTCIAVDYILVHSSKKDQLVKEMIRVIDNQYSSTGKDIKESPDLGRIISDRHYNRSVDLLQDAVSKGARVLYGGKTDDSTRYISPTILDGLSDDMLIMKEEIFCPLLPVISFSENGEAVTKINTLPKPLSLYIFSDSKHNVNYFLKNTTAGGGIVNDTLVHFANESIPFGGINTSGIGNSNGHDGLLEFLNQRGMMDQKLGLTKNLLPPYGKHTMRILNWLAKYFT